MLSCCWKQFYASLDRSVRQEMLLCSWERLCTSLDRSVRQETLSCRWKRFYANMDGSVRQEMVLCSWNQIYTTDCWHELHFKNLPKFELECAEPIYVVMTHHTAKANLEKGSCWPPEAIPYGLSHTRGLVFTQATCPTPWTRPQIPLGPSPPLRFDY